MTAILTILFVTVVVASVTFMLLLFRLSVEDADFWLRPMTAALAFFTFLAVASALWTGHFVFKNLSLQVSSAQTEASNAKTRADQEAVKRATLEKSVARREIGRIFRSDGSSNLDSLKPFAGVNVIIEYLPNDIETRRAFPAVEAVMRETGWNISKPNPNPALESPEFDGVTVGSYLPKIPPETPLTERLAKQQASTDALHAAEALIELLMVNNWEVRYDHDASEGLPANTIRVRVGFKSLPLVLNEEFQKILEEAHNKTKPKTP